MTRMWSAQWWAQRRKGIIAALGALATIAGIIWGPDNKVGLIIQVVIVFVSALGVYAVPNAPMPAVQPQGKHALPDAESPYDYRDNW